MICKKKQWILLWHNQLHGGGWLDYKVFSMCGSLHSKFIVERKNKWIKRWCTTSDSNTSNRQLTNVEPIFKLIFLKTISFVLCAIETNAQRNITWLLAIFFFWSNWIWQHGAFYQPLSIFNLNNVTICNEILLTVSLGISFFFFQNQAIAFHTNEYNTRFYIGQM